MDLFPPHLYQAVLTDFISEGHFSRHIRKTRLLYRERRSALVEAIESELDIPVEIRGAEAGMHLALTLPKDLGDEEISQRAAAQKLLLWPLSTCYVGKPAQQGFILGFAGTKAPEMRQAVRRMRNVLKAR
jgi:GntR family transcriptional regulator / MocR family aminotransferase